MGPTLIGDIISSQISPIEEKNSDNSIMRIMGCEHLENIWSNIYAYFFDSTNPHGFNRLFFDCLVELISAKCNDKFEIPQYNFEVNTYLEVATDTNKDKDPGRIDILIYAGDTAIIIENKVQHNLEGNNLNDYLNYVKNYSDNKKTGIVLSLSPMTIPDSRYINITHLEFMHSVVKQLPNFKDGDPFCKQVLLHFFENIKKMSIMDKSNEQKFLRNRLHMLEAARIVDDVKHWYHKIFSGKEFLNLLNKQVGENISLTPIHTERKTAFSRYVHFQVNNSKLLLAITFEPLWNLEYKQKYEYLPSNRQSIFVSLQLEGFDKIRSTNPTIEKSIKKIVESINSSKEPTSLYHPPFSCSWWLFATVEIPIDDENLFDNKILTEKVLDGEAEISPIISLLNNPELHHICNSIVD